MLASKTSITGYNLYSTPAPLQRGANQIYVRKKAK